MRLGWRYNVRACDGIIARRSFSCCLFKPPSVSVTVEEVEKGVDTSGTWIGRGTCGKVGFSTEVDTLPMARSSEGSTSDDKFIVGWATPQVVYPLHNGYSELARALHIGFFLGQTHLK